MTNFFDYARSRVAYHHPRFSFIQNGKIVRNILPNSHPATMAFCMVLFTASAVNLFHLRKLSEANQPDFTRYPYGNDL